MPELPEVEVVRRGLEQWVAGRTVAAVEVHHPRAVRRHLEGAEHFVAALTGRTLTAAHRRGKYLWLPLAEPDGAPSGRALVAHLGMSGQLLVEKPSQPDETHLRARFTFTDGGRELRFVDQRTFGGLAVEESCRATADPRRGWRTSRSTRSTTPSTSMPSPPRCAGGAPRSSGRCSTRPSSAASATSTPTRRCGGPGCTAPGPPTSSPAPRSPTCSTASATCWGRRWPRAAPPSTPCTSTSTGRAATSRASSPSTARPTGPARAAGRRSAASRS